MSVMEIKQLHVIEKFQLLEALWEDLSDRIVDMPVSKADRDLLDDRLKRVSSGEAELLNWDDVKYDIGEK